MSEIADHDLMLEVAAGRSERVALLFDRYQRRLFNFFLRLGHGHAASDDLVQDTFLRVLRHAGSYRSDGNFIGWLFRIARNVAADAWQQQAGLAPLDDEQEQQLPASVEHEPSALQEQAALERRLQWALAQLSRENRELVLLARVKELTTAELAQLFGCNEGAVKVRLHRALVELRRHFDASDDSALQVEKSHEYRDRIRTGS